MTVRTPSAVYTSVFTVGCFGLVGWLAWHPRRAWSDIAVLVALALWCTNRTVAVWTTLLGDGRAGEVQLEIFDGADGPWGHVLVDRIAVVGSPRQHP